MRYYFKNCKTLEDLKKNYKRLAMDNHPDRGGDLETMKEINRQYEIRFEKLKNKHLNREGETYEKETSETPHEFIDLINKLLDIPNIEIEIIGSFVWLSGDTKPVKDTLKAMGFRYSANKKMWYLAPAGYHKKSRKKYTIEEIRDNYGIRYRKKNKGKTEEQLLLA